MLRIFNLELDIPGANVAPVPTIIVANQPLDRRTKKAGLTNSVIVSLHWSQLGVWDLDVIAWDVERSDNGGILWSTIATAITDSSFYVDHVAPGTYRYRAKTRTAFAVISATGNELEVLVDDVGSFEDGAVNQVNAATGVNEDRIGAAAAFPNGLGEACIGTSICVGSLGGSYGSGGWYAGSRELIPPISITEVPTCGAVDVALPLTSITYTLRDLPYPVGGSGIKDTSVMISLTATSVAGGTPRIVWDGSTATSPWSPDVVVGIIPGANPTLERDVTITLDPTYIAQSDVVTVSTALEDNDGNQATLVCSFTMIEADVTGPVIDQQNPECDLGVTAGDLRRAPRNTPFSFRVIDNDSGVDLATLQVFHGPSTTGPWTQVLQNGSTFLLDFFGNVTALTAGPDSGYTVSINRPIASQLWDPDILVCFRIDVDDVAGNSTQDICCFQTAGLAGVRSVIPLGEGILFVEFTVPMERTSNLLDVANYSIVDQATGLDSRILDIAKQKFFIEPQNSENPTLVQGDGDPTYIIIRTVEQAHWNQHKLTVTGVLDSTGAGISAIDQANEGTWVARSTKFDLAIDSTGGMGVDDDDNLTRNLMLALSFGQEQIGGTFEIDNWKAGDK